MSQRRGTETSQLSNVIQVLQLGRKTGILSVEREGNQGIEEGRIAFMQGNITEAQLGRLIGQAALSLFGTWNTCRFIFTPMQVEKITRPLPAIPPYKFSESTDPRLPTISPGMTESGKRTTDYLPISELSPTFRAPQRLRSADEALRLLERAGLSRGHRHLLLLLDGQRTIPELSRLMNRGEEEVKHLLHDLAQLGIT
jgi:hypothetical protein